MSDSSYNGWTNYETWATSLYLDGNYDGEGEGEGTYRHVLDLAREHAADDYSLSACTYAFTEALEAFVTESLPELDGLAADLLNAAVSEVNWRELAESKLAEIKENDDA